MKRASSQYHFGREVVLQARNLTAPEARLIVANYYASQEARKRSDMQIRHLGEKDKVDPVPEGHASLLDQFGDKFAIIEGQFLKMLEGYAEGSPVGRWCMSLYGVGPVIAAGVLAHIDITQAPTAGHIWAFAGLDPTRKWKKGEKRPYNPDLKQLMFHFGECAKRASGNEEAFYGKLYRERKELLVLRNEAGEFAERAKVYYTTSAEVKKTLATGKLPAGNLDRQACNYAAKIFLSHLHAVMFWDKYNKAPPRPFAISILGHGHEIRVPQTEKWPGPKFVKAYYGPR